MSELMAIMPHSHYKGACNAIREATGKTEKIKSGDLEAEVRAAIAAGGGGADNSIVGTWVFNDVITTVLDVVDTQEKWEKRWDDCMYTLSGYAIRPDGNCLLDEFGCWLINGEFEDTVYDNSIEIFEANDSLIYDSDYGGWETPRTIVITEEPSPKVATWIRANATKKETVGTWVFQNDFNNPVSDDDITFHVNFETVNLEGKWCVFDEITVYDNSSLSFFHSDGSAAIEDIADENGWYYENARTIKILDEPTDTAFLAWLNMNATKQTDMLVYLIASEDYLPTDAADGSVAIIENTSEGEGRLLYIRENGEWILLENDSEDGDEGDSGGGSNKWVQIIERTVTEITAEDLPGVTTIGSYAFGSCSLLSKLELPNSIKSVGLYSFNNCAAIEEIVLPGSIEELNTACFYGCSKLKKVIFNKGISEISHQAFNRCVALQELDFTKCTFVPKLLNVNAFGSVPTTCVIKVPATLYDEWKAATNWSNYADYMVAV